MKKLLVAAFALALPLAGGCVSKATHQKELDQTRAEMQKTIDADKAAADAAKTAADAKDQSLADAMAKEQSKGANLSAQIDDLQKELAKAQSDLAASKNEGAKAESDLAAMMKDRSKLKASVDDMQKALDELNQRKAESEQRIAEFKGLLDHFKSMIDSGKLKVKIVDGRMVVELATDVLFASGSARLSPEGTAAITQVTGVLTSIPGRKFQIEGHTDNVPIKTAQYPSNWELAAARAITVVRTMVDGGMPASRVSGATFAEFKPATSNDTPEGRAANRRIEIVLMPDLGSLPGFEELNKIAGTPDPATTK